MMRRHGNESERTRWCRRIVGSLLLLTFVVANVSLAQPAPANKSAAEPAAAPAAEAPRVLDQNRFPPTPTPFFRGNLPIELSRSGANQVGLYLNLWRFVPFVADAVRDIVDGRI